MIQVNSSMADYEVFIDGLSVEDLLLWKDLCKSYPFVSLDDAYYFSTSLNRYLNMLKEFKARKEMEVKK